MIKAADRLGRIEEYFFSSKLKEIRERKANGEDIINMGIGNPDLPPSQNVIEALQSASLDKSNHGYQSYSGIIELREAFSDFYRRSFNVSLDPHSEILPLIGSKEGIHHVTMSFLNPGDIVLIPNPGYLAYGSAAKLAGAISIQYDLTKENNYTADFSQLSQFDLDRVKLMWLTYPNMPTGAKPDYQYFKKLVEFAKEHDILLCHDNPYFSILNEDRISIHNFDPGMSHTMELISLSKTFNMAGWRVGALSSNSHHVSSVLKYKSNVDSGMFKPIQLAAVEALNNNREWMDSLNKIYEERRELVYKLLDKLECNYQRDQAGLFVWAKIPVEFGDGYHFSEEILNELKVFFAPGNIFGSNGDQFIRVSLCVRKEQIETAIERSKSFKLRKSTV